MQTTKTAHQLAHKQRKNKEVSHMSEEKKQEILDELKEALAGVPEKYHKEVAAALTHDAGLIARTIRMVEKAPG